MFSYSASSAAQADLWLAGQAGPGRSGDPVFFCNKIPSFIPLDVGPAGQLTPLSERGRPRVCAGANHAARSPACSALERRPTARDSCVGAAPIVKTSACACALDNHRACAGRVHPAPFGPVTPRGRINCAGGRLGSLVHRCLHPPGATPDETHE